MKNEKLLFKFLFAASIFSVVFGFIFIEWIVSQRYNDGSVAKPTLASKLSISTNKTKYKFGETVKIVITNSAENPIVEQATSSVNVKSNRFLGRNYGVGLIEKFEDARLPGEQGAWIAVEPVWRCGDSCFSECQYNQSIKPTETRTFSWNQTILICDKFNHTENIQQAEAGKYRISSAIWSHAEKTYKIIRSNEFVIKEK